VERIKAICIPTHRKIVRITNVENYTYVPIEIISRILPKELHNKGFGYILFYDVEEPNEILAISFKPANFSLKDFYESRVLKTFKIIRSCKNLIDAYSQLLKSSAALRLVDNDGYISRISLIHLSRDWKEVIDNNNYPNFREFKKRREYDVELVERISQKIEEFRVQLIRDIDKANNEVELWRAEDKFDKSVIQEFENFLDTIESERGEEERIPLLHKYATCLDQETIKFIKSVYRAENFLLSTSRLIQSKFDFTCLGVILWKAIEVELNASIIRFLRMKYKIIDFYQPLINKIPKGGLLKVNGVNLNDVDENEELKSLMFGGLKKIINQSHKISLKEDMENSGFTSETIDFVTNRNGTDCLPKKVTIIHSIRNPHSHTKAMSYENYQELRTNILEPDLEPENSVLGRIANMKCQLNEKNEKWL